MLQRLTKLNYLMQETLLGLRRGGWMNWAAISTVMVLLFLFGVNLQASWQLERLLNQFGSQLEVSVYLQEAAEPTAIQASVAALPEVASVAIVPREEAWASLVKDLGVADIAAATDQLNGNPLVDELRVQVREAEAVASLAQRLEKLPGVDTVQYLAEAVQRLEQLNRGFRWLSVSVTTLLTLTAIAVITTTIRLIVMARRREIEVMQLVGATTGWIYFPFILQGLAFGVAGAAIAWGLLGAVQQFLRSLLTQQADFIQFLAQGLALTAAEQTLLTLILLGFGGSVGLLGSLLAVRRFAVR